MGQFAREPCLAVARGHQLVFLPYRQRPSSTPVEAPPWPAYGILSRIFCISAAVKARITWVRTLPALTAFKTTALAAISSLDSEMMTISYCPWVQNTSLMVTPAAALACLAASVRLIVSLMLRAPCSVKLMSVT